GERFGLTPETKESQQANEQRAQEIAAEIRDELLADGYGSTIRRWSRVLGVKCTEREAQRLEQLVEVAYDYDVTWTLRPYQFVEHVREQRVADRTGARVRLMTMHASKGLGFDIVVAPLNKTRSGWTSSPPEVVTGRSDPAGPIDAVSRYVRSDDRPLLPDRIQEVFCDYQAQQINEELCLLYVTLTRAKQHLSVILPPKAEPDWANVIGVLLRALSGKEADQSGKIASFGSPDWLSA
ncbi:MAG: 3'-5' exonuclease, partial [Planctomycetota bacterium]